MVVLTNSLFLTAATTEGVLCVTPKAGRLCSALPTTCLQAWRRWLPCWQRFQSSKSDPAMVRYCVPSDTEMKSKRAVKELGKGAYGAVWEVQIGDNIFAEKTMTFMTRLNNRGKVWEELRTWQNGYPDQTLERVILILKLPGLVELVNDLEQFRSEVVGKLENLMEKNAEDKRFVISHRNIMPILRSSHTSEIPRNVLAFLRDVTTSRKTDGLQFAKDLTLWEFQTRFEPVLEWVPKLRNHPFQVRLLMPTGGKSVEDQLQFQPTPETVQNAFKQLVAGLQHMHRDKGFAHLDLSSANLTWDSGKLSIIDFDFIQELQDGKMPKDWWRAVTAQWRHPQLMAQDPDFPKAKFNEHDWQAFENLPKSAIAVRADWWAALIVLLELLWEVHPIPGKRAARLEIWKYVFLLGDPLDYHFSGGGTIYGSITRRIGGVIHRMIATLVAELKVAAPASKSAFKKGVEVLSTAFQKVPEAEHVQGLMEIELFDVDFEDQKFLKAWRDFLDYENDPKAAEEFPYAVTVTDRSA